MNAVERKLLFWLAGTRFLYLGFPLGGSVDFVSWVSLQISIFSHVSPVFVAILATSSLLPIGTQISPMSVPNFELALAAIVGIADVGTSDITSVVGEDIKRFAKRLSGPAGTEFRLVTIGNGNIDETNFLLERHSLGSANGQTTFQRYVSRRADFMNLAFLKPRQRIRIIQTKNFAGR